jgi:hypothetical protein
MPAQPASPPIASPTSLWFLVPYGIWETVAIVWFSLELARSNNGIHKGDEVELPLVVLLALLPLFGTARWVGRSPTALALFLRSVGMHALSPLLPLLVHAVLGHLTPAHGAAVLMILVTYPFAGAACAVLGGVATLATLGVAVLRRRGAGAEPPR